MRNRPKHAIPLPDERTAKTWGWLRGAAATIGAVAVVVWGAASWDHNHPTRADLREVEKAHASMVDKLNDKVLLLRDKVNRTEVALDYISRAVYEVAQRTGATAVPPPPPAAAPPAP